MSEAWLPVVRVHVDQPWQQVKPANVHHTSCLVTFAGRQNAGDLLPRDGNIGLDDATLGHDHASF